MRPGFFICLPAPRAPMRLTKLREELPMTRAYLCLSAATLSVLSVSTFAQAASPEEVLTSKLRAVTVVLDAQLKKESVPGAAFAIISDQDKVWSHQYGVEDLETQRAVSDDTSFSICSVSKLFTGVAVMDLVEAGRIDLDAPIGTYLGDGVTDAEDVTVRNLLSHVSGLPREGETDYWWDNVFPNDATLMVDVGSRDDWYDPYVHWQYSNLGMAALGQVIKNTSGESFHDYVNSKIFNPLAMENTTTEMPFEKVGQGFARGYYVRDERGIRSPVAPHQFRAFAAAAGVASSINDMSDFMSWHFRLRASEDEEILEPATLKTMQRVHWVGEDFDEPAWGLAYATRRYGEKTLWGHGGYCPGTVTDFSMRNPDKIGMIAMATANDISVGRINRMIYDMTASDVKAVYGKSEDDADKNDEMETVENPSVSLAEFEGHYGRPNYDWDVYIGLTEDGLFSIPLFDEKPQDAFDTFKLVEGDLFREVRKNGSDGAPLRFIRDDSGKITGAVVGGYRLNRR